MAKKYTLIFEEPRPQPAMGDDVEYAFPYSIVESQYYNQPDEMIHRSKQAISVRASGSLCHVWQLNEFGLSKVLFEFGKRRVIQNLMDGTLVSDEKLVLAPDEDFIPCPFDPFQILETNEFMIVVSVEHQLLTPLINTGGGTYIQGNVQAKEVIGHDKIEYHWHVDQGPGDPAKQAAQSILSACYRRAIFIRMHAQMHPEAMFQSIADAIRLVQPQIPNLASIHLQEIATNIVVELDNIVRIGSKHFSCWDMEQINESKLQVLHLLCRLAEETGLNFVIPRGRLSEGIFFTKAEADAAPDYV